ncbi:ATP-dependent DNA helicase II subunit 2 [Nakaseomyces bracarensis]|uniref:ATP-dependent DNA helicase II subunit 2 n=1 Tax=Nakaseomyces bracarensis TaxID=273131 RepID=A0ABR4NMZ8_9SACH
MSETTSILIDVAVDDLVIAKTLAYLEFVVLEKARRARKTDYLSVYLVNCPHTENSQEVDNVYHLCPFEAPITVDVAIDLVRKLAHSVHAMKRGYQGNNNILQALLVASLDLKSVFKKRKMLKQIMVFTDKVGELDLTADEISMMHEELDSRIILINCAKAVADIEDKSNKGETGDGDDGEGDDGEGGGEADEAAANNKSGVKGYAGGYEGSTWQTLVNSIGGSLVFHVDELLLRITQPVPRVVKPVSVFQGQLRLGADLEGIVDLRQEEKPAEGKKRKFTYMYEAEQVNVDDPLCLCIGVRGFPATKKVTSIHRVRAIKDPKNDSYTPVKSVIQYEVEGTKQDTTFTVANDSLTKAYRYGSDYVVLPSSIEDELTYQTYAGLDIRGFMDSSKLDRQLLTSESVFIIPNELVENQTSFSALVDAMRKIDKVAIARYVAKNNSGVHMVMLCPMILADNEGKNVRVLILNPLPFAEEDMTTLYPRLHSEEKDEKVDSMMEAFVNSRDWDPLPEVPENEYYQFFEGTERDTSLPLPLYDHDQSRQKDPLLVPAVVIHRQLQVMLEYIHQVLINESDTFCVPDLSYNLKEKMTPHGPYDYPHIEELVNLLNIKKVEPKSTSTKEESAEPVPSLEALLHRGETERMKQEK